MKLDWNKIQYKGRPQACLLIQYCVLIENVIKVRYGCHEGYNLLVCFEFIKTISSQFSCKNIDFVFWFHEIRRQSTEFGKWIKKKQAELEDVIILANYMLLLIVHAAVMVN